MGYVDTATKVYSEITGVPSGTFKFTGAAAVGTLVYFAPYVRTSPPRHTHTLHGTCGCRMFVVSVIAALSTVIPTPLLQSLRHVRGAAAVDNHTRPTPIACSPTTCSIAHASQLSPSPGNSACAAMSVLSAARWR